MQPTAVGAQHRDPQAVEDHRFAPFGQAAEAGDHQARDGVEILRGKLGPEGLVEVLDLGATAHSRFPVIDRNRDHVIGILLAKDLLRYYAGEEEFNVRDMLRPAIFIPESKALNVLLREFRASRNHMAIVVDEYGGVAGLVTIEDVLEQIVGDIEDEYDFDESADNIVRESSGQWRVRGRTEIEDFNAAFGTEFPSEDFDTVAGLVIARLGRLPKRGESVNLDGLRVTVLRADSRRLHLVSVQKLPRP